MSDAGEGYSLGYNRVSGGTGLDRVSACRTLRFTTIHDLLMVSQEHGSDHSILGENLHSFWYYAVSAVCRRRCTCFLDRSAEKASGTLVKVERRTAGRCICFD